ncbi:hypothetical protein [Demequina aurantiaca]|uniref:hypothetical protein n=1 Tax=Demequina aurantiaca TaxID=676200 RepID=UPI003D34685C
MTDASKQPPEASPRARRYIQLFMGFLLLTLLLYFLSIPFLYFTWISAPATIVFAILALVASRTRTGITGLRVGLSLGIAMSCLAMLLALGTFFFQDSFIALRDCQARALTISAQQQCQDDYDAAYEKELEKFGVTLP